MIIDKLNRRMYKTKSFLCVGLDTDHKLIPKRFRKLKHPVFAFNKWIIDQTHQYVIAYKPNIAFYEAASPKGLHQLTRTVSYIRKHYPDIVTICDAKRADIGNSSERYATAIFDKIGFDAVTLNPYLGYDSLEPFLSRKDKACIILCKTSNPGSKDFQDLLVGLIPLWKVVAKTVVEKWNTNNNCMMVVGATYPAELKAVRKIAGDMPFLVPGVGKQGGSIEDVFNNGLTAKKRGVIINSSRGIIYADDPKKEAQLVASSCKAFM